MNQLEFDFEWIDPAGASGSELRATWARLQILVDDEPVTRLIDDVSRSVRTSVYLPLYPLAEWIATNWWFLFYEIERRGSPQSLDYEQRHNLRFGSEGFALPSVSFAPTGGSMRVQWTPMRLKHERLEFTGRGIAQISVEDLRNTLLGFLQAVTGRLDESGVTQSLLANEVRAINEIDPQEEHFCAAAAALGLEPYSLRDSQAEEIVDIAQKLPPSVVAEFFVIAEYQQLRQQAAELLKGIRASQVNEADLTPLNELKQQSVGNPSTSPWAQGYHFATELRDRLALDDQRFDSLESLGAGLRVKPSELNRAVSQAFRGGAALDAIVGVNKRGSPSFSIRSRSETGLMFAVCRALYEYLTTSGTEPSIVTRARSDRQKRNRAFAAEFLIPAAVLRPAMPSNIITYEDVDDLARQFGVSTTVIRHQIDNHGLGYVNEF